MIETELFNVAVNQWRDKKGRGTMICPKPLDCSIPLVTVLTNVLTRSPTANILVLVDEFTDRLAVINKFKAKEFKLEEGKFLGGEDFMKDYKENHKSLFVPDEPQEPIPQIVKPTGGNNPGGDTNPFKFNFMGVRPVNK